MKKTLIIARFNFKNTVESKIFIIMTLIGPLLILALAIIPGLLAQKTMVVREQTPIGLVGFSPELMVKIEEGSGNVFLFTFFSSEEEARRAVTAEEVNGFILEKNGGENFFYVSRTATDIVTYETLKSIINRVIIGGRLESAGMDPAYIKELSRDPGWVQQKISSSGGGEEPSGGFTDYLYTVIGFVMLLYMTTLLYGQMIGRSVVMEKTSKTVEVMLSSVRPGELLFGKILGLGLAGLVQYIFWISLSLFFILIIGPAFNLVLPASINPANLGFLFLFFVLAFLFYSSLYAAIGAASEDEQHLGQLSWPIIIFLMIPMLLIASLVSTPGGGLTRFLSFFPMTAPTVMLIRVLVQMPPLWELGLFLLIMTLSILGAVIGSGKIFRMGILLSGKKLSLGEVIKLLRA